MANPLGRVQSFIFGEGTDNPTYEDVKTKRALQQALMQKLASNPPTTFGGGVGAIFQGVAARRAGNVASEGESAGKAESKKRWDALSGLFGSSLGGPAAGGQAMGGMSGGMAAPMETPAPVAMSAPAPGADAIRSGLVARGLPEHVADGFMMNFQDESNLNPGIEEQVANVHGTKGFGLAQWTGPRREALTQFARSQGKPVSDVDVQLDFLMTELQGSERGAAQSILSAQDAPSAASAIVNDFLRPAEEHRARRVAEYTGGNAGAGYGGGQGSPMGGMNPQAMMQIAEFMDDPYASDGQKALAGLMMERMMAQPDRPELVNAGSGNIYDPASGQWIIAPRGPTEPMSSLGKLEADRAAGLISDEAYQAELASMAPQGMSIESDGAGGFRMVQGAGAGDTRPFTEGQSRDNVFVTRAEGALSVLDPIAENLTSRTDRAAEMVPFGLARGTQSDDFQVAKNAGDEFLQAILRKDTGAAITEPEQALYGVTYLPQPGDSAAVLAQKAQARRRAIEAIKSGQSPSQLIAVERALQASGSAQLPPVDAPAAPAVPGQTAAPAAQADAAPDFTTMSNEELQQWLAENE